MKRIILGAAAVAAAAAVTLAFSPTAGATAGGNSVSIDQYADFNFAGTQLDLGLQVSCTSTTGSGTVNVTVDEAYPDAPSLLGAHGTGVQDVVCDGKTRYVTVTIIGTLFDGGKATAKATVRALTGSTASTQRQISIRAT